MQDTLILYLGLYYWLPRLVGRGVGAARRSESNVQLPRPAAGGGPSRRPVPPAHTHTACAGPGECANQGER